MNKPRLVAVVFLIAVASCIAEAGNDSKFIIGPHRVGTIAVGMMADEAAKTYPAGSWRVWEPYSGMAVLDIVDVTRKEAAPDLRCMLDRKTRRVRTIEVSIARYKTAQGISIGSTFGELRKAHTTIKAGTQAGEMDNYIVAILEQEGLIFNLQFDEGVWKKMDRQANRQDIDHAMVPDHLKIIGITVY